MNSAKIDLLCEILHQLSSLHKRTEDDLLSWISLATSSPVNWCWIVQHAPKELLRDIDEIENQAATAWNLLKEQFPNRDLAKEYSEQYKGGVNGVKLIDKIEDEVTTVLDRLKKQFPNSNF